MHEGLEVRSNRKSRWLALPAAIAVAAVLAGCSAAAQRGYLPGTGNETNHTQAISELWVGSWVVLLGVGALVWGLTIWAVIVYRRRKGQTGLPYQLRYNMPIEMFFTIVPLILVIGFFAFTVRVQTPVEQRYENPDVTVEVWGKQWAFDFNYLDEDKYFSGIQVQPTDGSGGTLDESTIPVLYLPVGKTVELQIKSRDVVHSFWVPKFLYKKDMIPYKTNYMSFIPEEIGTYEGKCAELCGQHHSMMLFTVKVVSEADYKAYVATLQDGRIGEEYNRMQIPWLDAESEK